MYKYTNTKIYKYKNIKIYKYKKDKYKNIQICTDTKATVDRSIKVWGSMQGKRHQLTPLTYSAVEHSQVLTNFHISGDVF